ncbi:MAG: serine/threonine protein kinase [Gemmatimonadaceae bacterium]|nr:serine/threonine protein kinase [Gemmatimonadaceae bacterium]
MTAIDLPTPDPRALDDEARPFAESIALHYAIKREIGRGGNGVVYLARDRRLDRLVAIKTLPPHLAKDASVRERFLREARTAGAMSHPNIVAIHSANESDSYVYFVMALVDGASLAAHIRAHDRLPARVVACYLRDVASALVHAHSRGIVHRDIKAENVLIERESGRALVSDFGIARIAEATPLTATGQMLGTVYYVSPEQVSGADVDARSDLYSLGVVGFLALTGRFPFESDLASAVLVSHVTKTAPLVMSYQPDVPPALAAVIDRCLMKDPSARFGSALDMVAALETVIAGLDNPAMVSTALPPVPEREMRVSDTEAHAVWKRASELQALTGIQPRPVLIPGARDAQRGRFGGMTVRDVREAAVEAGIDAPYVEHALVEIGVGAAPDAPLVSSRASTPIPSGVVARSETSSWRRVARTFEVEAEVASGDLERLINVLRDETGTMGRVEARSRELAWWTGRFGRRLDVSMVPTHGRSHFRLTKDLTSSTLLAAVGTLTTVGFGSGALAIATVLEFTYGHADGSAATLGLAVGALTTFYSTRMLTRWMRRRTERRLHALAEALAAKVRERLIR